MPGSGRGQSKVLAEPCLWGSGGRAEVKPRPRGLCSAAMWTSALPVARQGAPVPVLLSGPCSQLRVGLALSCPCKHMGLSCEPWGAHPPGTREAPDVGRWPIGAHRTQATSTLDRGPPARSCPRTRTWVSYAMSASLRATASSPPGFSKLMTLGQPNSVFFYDDSKYKLVKAHYQDGTETMPRRGGKR